jgi:predicted Fe-Mo cluster-binding NifX family protein
MEKVMSQADDFASMHKERNKMRIAVPTNDGVSISEHFGRSAAFLIFEIENGQIKSLHSKSNGARHSHAQGACDHHSADHKPHSHAGILAALEGCDIVICGGMGQKAAEALRSCGTQILVAPPASAEDTVVAYLAGKLTPQTERFCGCQH